MLNIEPRSKQEIALNMLRREWKNDRTFLLYAPVGFGKTVIAALITDGFVANKMRILFVAPYTVLIEQTVNRFVKYGINADEISIIWQNHPAYDPDKLIQIASVDTLIRRNMPKNIDLIIIDEAHLHRKKLLEYIRDTKAKVIGLSGTPFAEFMGKYYNKLIKPTSMKELIKLGDLSTYEFYAPTKPDLKGVKTQSTSMGNDYKENEIAEIMCGADLIGNIVDNWLKNGQNLPTICFCVNVKHAHYITEQFNRNGVKAEIMTAGTPQDERKTIISHFESGITKIIVNVGVLVAGFDSDVRCIIYARPTKSEIRWIQCLGRGLRTAKGKDKCVIFDHSGTVHRLGFPDDIEYDSLVDGKDGLQSQQRQVKQIERKPKECPKCHYVKAIGVYECPKCGFRPVVREDVETDENRELKALKSKDIVFTPEQKQSWWSQIKFFQKERTSQGKPLSDGWCANLYRKKFGVWPRGLHESILETSPEVRNYIKHSFIAFAKSNKRKEQVKVISESEKASIGKQRLQILKDQLVRTSL